jgi:hypothetical protein
LTCTSGSLSLSAGAGDPTDPFEVGQGMKRSSLRSRASLVALALALGACNHTASTLPFVASNIQASGANAGVTAAIVGDRVHIRSEMQMPVEYALFEERWLETTLASYCFGSGGCGTTILTGQTATPFVSSATGMTSTATKLVVVWWAIPEEPPPMGRLSTPYKIVLDVR